MRRTHRALVVGFIALVAVTASACTTRGTAFAPTKLGGVEIRRYKGEKLGAISDFHENSIKGPQDVDRGKYRLKVDGTVDTEASYTYQQVIARPKHLKVVQLDCVEGWSVKVLWQGVMLSEIIDASHPRPDARTVIFHAADGYTTSLPLAYVRDRQILLAYRMNGVELPKERGFPFQVVAESKWGYKWCKWVTRIELSPNADYRGYWEQRGYSTLGDLDKSSFSLSGP